MLDGVVTAAERIAAGGAVVLVDDGPDGDEGQVAAAAQFATAELVNFMATHARGVVGVGLTEERCRDLGLTEAPRTSADAGVPRRAPFTESIDAREGVPIGASAEGRALTIRVAADPQRGAEAFVLGGHVTPLRAWSGGVIARAGYAEAIIDLARIAGCEPAGMLCAVLGDDGALATGVQLAAFAERHDLPLVRISDLLAYRRTHEVMLERVADAQLPTRFGSFAAIGYRDVAAEASHMALVRGDVEGAVDVPVRVHPECIFGDVFRAGRCDCRQTLDAALELIDREGAGIVVYLAFGDRGARMREWSADHLADHGVAGMRLHEQSVAAQILADLAPSSARLLVGSGEPPHGMGAYGLDLTGHVELVTAGDSTGAGSSPPGE